MDIYAAYYNRLCDRLPGTFIPVRALINVYTLRYNKHS